MFDPKNENQDEIANESQQNESSEASKETRTTDEASREKQVPVVHLETPSISRELLYVAAILLVLFFGFMTWAAFAPLESVAIAQSVIKVAGSNKLIQHPQGGTIKEALVKENEEVKAGQPLILLDDPQVESKARALEKSISFYEIKRTRLVAQLENKEKISFPEDILEQSNEPDIAKLIETENNLFEKSKQTHLAELSILMQQINQLEQQQQQAEASYKTVTSQKEYLQQELKAVQYLLEKQLARKPRFLALQRENARLDGEMSKGLNELSRIEHQKEEVKAKINGVQKEWFRKHLQELEETEQHLLELEPQLISANKMEENLIIKAPVDGIVKGLRYKTPGEVLKSGESVMEIVPTGEPLVIEAQIDPQDIKEVHPGLKARITIRAFSLRYSPNFYGKVEYVSPDAFIDERTNRRYYLARISDFDENWKKIEQKLTPGMPAEVMIINDERTVLHYIFSPIFQSFQRSFREI